MSERIHSPAEADAHETAGQPHPGGAPQGAAPQGAATVVGRAKSRRWPFRAPSRKQLVWVLGGAATAAVLTVAVTQFLRPDGLSADDVREATNRQLAEQRAKLRQRPLARVGRHVVNYDMVADEAFIQYGNEVLENVINRLVIQQACEDRGVSVSLAEVDAEVLRISQKFNLTPDNWYAMLQAERNISPLQYRRDIIWPMLALKKLAGETVDVTQADLQKGFESNYGPRVQVRMIMLDNFRHAESVWSEAKQNPADFERLAQKHSIEPNSRALGGTVPPIRKHVGNPQIVEAAFKLKVGEISPVLQAAPGRWVLLKCEGFTEPKVKQMTPEVQQELYTSLVEEKTQLAIARVFEDIKKQVRVDNYLKDITTGGVQQASGEQPAGSTQPPVQQATQQQPARQ
jgi:foldase protein PrsA